MVQLAFFTRHYCRAICKTIFRDNLQLEFIVTIFKKIVKPREVIVMEYKEKVKRRESFIIAHFTSYFESSFDNIYLNKKKKRNVSITIRIKNKKLNLFIRNQKICHAHDYRGIYIR